MGLSRLLQQRMSLRFRTIGFARQTKLQFSTSSSAGNKTENAARGTQTQADEKHMHTGTSPKRSHFHKEIWGSWYTLKELLQNAKEKIFGSPKVQSDFSNDIKSTSIPEVITTQENGLGKSGHGEASNTVQNAVCSKNNIPPSAAPYTSGEISSGMMGDTVLDTNRAHNDLENIGPGKSRNSIQSSALMISGTDNNSVSRKISNVTENHCSEGLLNATSSTGVCDAPYQTGLPEAASDANVNSVRVVGVSNNQNRFQKNNELQDPFDKSNKLSSIIFEATRSWQEEVEDEMASTRCRNEVENRMYVDRYDKKPIEPSAAKLENGHLESVEKPSEAPLCSNTEITDATLQGSVPNNHVLVGNGLNQPENKQNFLSVEPVEVPKEGGKPASDDYAQKLVGLAALFDNIVDHEAGKIMNCNILETGGHMESSEGVSQGNLPNSSDINDLIDSLKGYPIGRQVASDPGSVISNKSDQKHYSDHIRVLSQVNMQNLNNEGRPISSHHSYERNIKYSIVEAPVKIINNNEKTCNQHKGNVESAALNADKSNSDSCVPAMRIKQLDKAQDTTSIDSLDQNKVLVKFVHGDANQREVINVLECFGNILKIELSGAGQSSFKTAVVYFAKRQGMQKALQATDLSVRGVALTLETASSLESQCEKITIPSLIGDPDAPVALLKNPMRTVAIKQMTCEICLRHIEEALAFCKSNVSGVFLGSSDSVAYVEFETEDGKERALAKQSIVVLGKHLLIFRVDAPRTTVVRIKTMSPRVAFKYKLTFQFLGKIKACRERSPFILDLHFCITEWHNILQILNKLNGMEVHGMKLIAEPAPIIPPDVLCHIYRQPEERKHLKGIMLNCLRKLEGNAVNKKKITDSF